MNRYALIQGNLVSTVVEQDDVPTVPGTWVLTTTAGPGWTYDNDTFSPPAAVTRPNHITSYAFKSRMTSAERIAIRQAAAASAAVYDWLDLADSARYIDLDLPATRDGVIGLETATLLASGRALEILDAPVLDIERP